MSIRYIDEVQIHLSHIPLQNGVAASKSCYSLFVGGSTWESDCMHIYRLGWPVLADIDWVISKNQNGNVVVGIRAQSS
jgi:hypothetical protein